MSSFDPELATTECRYQALHSWWQRHCKPFCQWYLTQPSEKQIAMIKETCPDLPMTSRYTREANGEQLFATDAILPEVSVETLTMNEGKIFILFITRRMTDPNLGINHDIELLNNLFERKLLPSFSNGSLNEFDTPFIDPTNPDKIQSLTEAVSENDRKEIMEHLKAGRLVHADVWLALHIRRSAIVAIIEGLFVKHEEESPIKLLPSYESLVKSELETLDMLRQQDSLTNGEDKDNKPFMEDL